MVQLPILSIILYGLLFLLPERLPFPLYALFYSIVFTFQAAAVFDGLGVDAHLPGSLELVSWPTPP
ncbi:hypothetical protein APY94_05155 [Thermococcus celericrescens]|uniref:Uncharacterized protein n=2 Tax=Thermococcus TaxID=2263 RepID=A0A117ITD4_9EURY|nr:MULTISPECIES: hypothetical protein [Thermococcus]KUH33584.1 hypothetical protein APY94_05155 [Thermococcus celericrescens]QEK14388.1 hypothetical protein FPV09_03875 [Thermococcus aciditolerans]